MASSTAAAPSHHAPATPDTLITIKVQIDGTNRKFHLPLKDLGPNEFHNTIKALLGIAAEQKLKLERYSDSSSSYIVLEPSNPWAYKQLYRAAKAKLKLRIRASRLDTAAAASALPSPPKVTPMFHPPPPPPVPFHAFEEHTRSIPIRSINPFASPLIDLAEPQSVPMPTSSIYVPTMNRPVVNAPTSSWQVYCNSCDKAMFDVHYHCSICDKGDYDLCQSCVDGGKLCRGEDHWLVKRFFNSTTGLFTNSTTERIAPKPRESPAVAPEHMPGAFEQEAKKELPTTAPPTAPTRTCNNCVRIMPERLLISCANCDDYDLCVPCFKAGKHGHHPGHRFESIEAGLKLSPGTAASLAAGRNVRHAAICDGCDKKIHGIRHKCLDCPDWDYCGACFENVDVSHAGHRFAPIYEPLVSHYQPAEYHQGILCDGPLCKNKQTQSYIYGTRYKCAICHDVDFCGNCEAHPSNTHNKTHPLIKFKSHIRGVSVTTLGEDGAGRHMPAMGDRHSTPVTTAIRPVNIAHRPRPDSSNRASTASTLPTVPAAQWPPPAWEPAKQENADSKAPALDVKPQQWTPPLWDATKEEKSTPTVNPQPTLWPPPQWEANKVEKKDVKAPVKSSELDAHFVSDTIKDGVELASGQPFSQTWVMRNPGPHTWPAGCSVRFVGGDHMLNIDRFNVTSVDELVRAQESNRTEGETPPGFEASFTVQLRSPAQQYGKFISYWRLKAPDGTPFGHKLWCDIRTSNVGALADLQMQLMLLEQQNKKRIMMARQEQELKEQESGAAEKAVATTSSSSPVARSQLVFPSLEKESPVPSIHESKPVEQPAEPKAEASTAPQAEATATGAETFEDVMDSDDFSDDAFLTDDEYDILDASDEETNGGPSHA